MCTLSFRSESLGYELFFSRDERRSRAPARAPALEIRAGVRFLAPRDPEGGGTWLAANHWGVTLALLNHYGAPARGGDFASRGGLVSSLAGARSLSEVETLLRGLELARFRPFDLAAFAPCEPALRFGWDGAALEVERGLREPLCSSAVADAEAKRARRARFAELAPHGAPSSATLETFHREHAAGRGPLSTCMHREDAKTVSLSRVRVTPERVTLAYAAGSPCRARFAAELELARA